MLPESCWRRSVNGTACRIFPVKRNGAITPSLSQPEHGSACGIPLLRHRSQVEGAGLRVRPPSRRQSRDLVQCFVQALHHDPEPSGRHAGRKTPGHSAASRNRCRRLLGSLTQRDPPRGGQVSKSVSIQRRDESLLTPPRIVGDPSSNE